MTVPESPEPLSLFGGPLNDLGRRLGLVHGSNAVRLGLALGIGWWLVVVALALVLGRTDQIFRLSVVGGHARLLLVIPLFFVGETWVAPLMAAFVAMIVRNGIVRAGATPALSAAVARANRLASAWWPEAACLIAALALQIAGGRVVTYGTTGAYDPSYNWPGLAYFHVGVTLFRFLLFRWAWKLALWAWLLWRVSRLDLSLIPAHPDRAGGLGLLEGVHERFLPLVVALSILESASLAESISTGQLAATATFPWRVILLLVDGVVFLCPLLVFTDKLWACRTNGMGHYSALAARYVTWFEAKWTDRPITDGESLLGTPDIQSLADLANAFAVVRGMRWITAGPRLMTAMTIGALAPLVPLLLFEYPIAELTEKFFSRLIGL